MFKSFFKNCLHNINYDNGVIPVKGKYTSIIKTAISNR